MIEKQIVQIDQVSQMFGKNSKKTTVPCQKKGWAISHFVMIKMCLF